MIDLTHTGTREIETDRLLLRRLAIGDANEVFREWASYDSVVKYLTWEKHSSISETKTFLLGVIAGYGQPDKYVWGIQLKDEGILIGSISMEIEAGNSRTARAGYCLGERFWNCGFATEALRAVMDYMFYDVNINRIEAFHSVHNPASGRVMQKAGMFKEGACRQKYMAGGGEFQDADIYGLVKADFERQYEPEIKGFLDLGELDLSAYGLSLKCSKLNPDDGKKRRAPEYIFDIIEKNSGEAFGVAELRIGFSDWLYYGGHVGYFVNEKCRNMGVATLACGIVANLARAHKFKKILITSSPANRASRRVCEKIGARLIRIAPLPEWHDLYIKGQRFECIYELTL